MKILKILGMTLLVALILFISLYLINIRKSPLDTSNYKKTLEERLEKGKYCTTDNDCTKIDGGSEAYAVCYDNHCLNCTSNLNIMCGQGTHSCENTSLKSSLLQDYPEWLLECAGIPLTCCGNFPF